MNISEYHWGTYNNHIPKRDRKLLLQHRSWSNWNGPCKIKG